MRADFSLDLFLNHRNQPRNSELKKPVQSGFIEATLPRCTARPCRFGRAGPTTLSSLHRYIERKDPVRGVSEYHPKRAFSTQRLLLRTLLNGLGEAVRRYDQPAADRYRRRISQIAGHFETNAPVNQALERLLSASGQWLATNAPKRYEVEQHVVELIDGVEVLL